MVYWWQKKPFVLCQALFQLIANPFPSSQLTFLSSSTASGNGLHLPHAVFCSKSPESSTCYEHQRIQRPKTRKNKSTEKSAHADMVQRLPPLSLSLSLAIHRVRLDRLLARRQIQIRNKLCAVWRCLATYHRFLNPNSRTIDLFVCHVGPQSTFPLEDYIPTSESLRLCSRQWTSPFSYLECAVRLFSGAAKRSALQVWSCSRFGLRRACS